MRLYLLCTAQRTSDSIYLRIREKMETKINSYCTIQHNQCQYHNQNNTFSALLPAILFNQLISLDNLIVFLVWRFIVFFVIIIYFIVILIILIRIQF